MLNRAAVEAASSAATSVLRSVAPIAESIISLESLGPAGAQFLKTLQQSKSLVVLTGAGISTSSGIPDYRSPGRPDYRPLQHQQFMTDESVRRRYWARSFIGYPKMTSAAPNAAHFAIAELEKRGIVSHVITQNVDRLHRRAGSNKLIELHGTIHDVQCLDCGYETPRSDIQARMLEINQSWLEFYAGLSSPRPDGDVELPQQAYPDFDVPSCPCCGSKMLKPMVVFYGGNVPAATTLAASEAMQKADAVLVVGSTLTTWSAFRLIKLFQAREHPTAWAPIGIINFGATRADQIASFKLEAHISSVLDAALQQLR